MSLRAVFVGLGLVACELAGAQSYPDRPIRIINPFPAGGSGDVVMRTVADKLGVALGQAFVIEARPGASGAIATDYVAKAIPDGYTLILGTASTFGTNSSTQKSLPYDPVRDFAPIVMIATTPYLLLAHPSVQAGSLKDLVGYARSNPDKLNFGSFGNGSSNHLAFELLKQGTGIEAVHVPYKGGAPLIAALLAGEVQTSLDVYATAIPHVKAGRFKLLGVASAKRFSLLPDVRERLMSLGTEVAGGSPQDLATAVANEVDKWAKLVRARNLRFD